MPYVQYYKLKWRTERPFDQSIDRPTDRPTNRPTDRPGPPRRTCWLLITHTCWVYIISCFLPLESFRWARGKAFIPLETGIVIYIARGLGSAIIYNLHCWAWSEHYSHIYTSYVQTYDLWYARKNNVTNRPRRDQYESTAARIIAVRVGLTVPPFLASLHSFFHRYPSRRQPVGLFQ